MLRSPLTYGMVGHLKTVSILAGGYFLFNDSLNIKQFLGILLTLFGLFLYTFTRMKELSELQTLQDAVQHNFDTGSQTNTEDNLKSVN
jgi:drug/metabolite transporter (DMT)-like permease